MRGAAFHRAARRILPALALLPALLGGGALATPKGAQVVSGNVQIVQSGNLTTITASNLSIIQYLSFNIAKQETVQFVQPSAQSEVLNRILGDDPSIIAGTILSNGQVYIVNPAGIFFTNGCLVNVGGIYAAAGHISNQDFLANINRFTGLTGAVINGGLLRGNQVALIGSQVENFGAIVAPDGLVTLVSGEEVYFSDNDGQILVKLGGGVPAVTGAGVTNSGTIQAAGGTVNLAAGDLYALAIFNNGQITANAITVQGRAPGTAVQVSGTLDASSPYGVGGTIDVLGDQIALVGATLNASGATGGGTILVGGDLHGANPAVQDASETCVSADSSINADALVKGNGGKVVVWSNLDTQFYGSISARGGAEAGNGGNVEVSGHYLDFQGSVDTLAPSGTAGSLLLDPTNLVIDNGTNQNINGSSPFVPTASPSELTWATIQTNLGLGDVTVTTSGSPASAGQNGDITVAAASLDLASANKLTLSAVGTLYINYAITNSGGGALEFSGANGIQLGANVTSTGAQTYDNAVTLTGGVTLTASKVTFSSTVDSDGDDTLRDLTVEGNAEFDGRVGVTFPLSSLYVTGTTLINTDTITTAAYGAGTVTFGGAVTIADGVSVNITAPTLAWFESTVDGQAYGTSNLTVTGNAEFDAPVGSNVPLGSLGVTGTTLINTDTIATSTSNGGAGTMTFGGAVTIGDGVPAYITAPTLALFQAAVDGQSEPGSSNLTVAGNAELDGRVGSNVAFGWFWVTGATLINTDTIAASTANGGRGEVEFGGAVTIADGISVNIIAPGLPWFQGAVDGQSVAGTSNLTVTGNNAQFEGPVGSSVPFGSVDVTGTALVLTDTIATSTSGDGAGTVTFGGAVTIWPGVSLNITAPTLARFQSTLDAAGQSNLTVTGNAEFDGRVGSGAALGSLDVTGTTLINTDTITTSTSNGGAGTATFGGAVAIADGVSVNITAPGLAKFESTLDGYSEPGSSSLTIAGNAEFDNPVGSNVALQTLTVTGTTGFYYEVTGSFSSPGTYNTGGTPFSVQTAGGQSYEGPVTLHADTALSAGTSGSAILFGGTVDSDSDLTPRFLAIDSDNSLLQATGYNAQFNGAVGAGHALSVLDVDANGTIAASAVATTTSNGGVGYVHFVGAVTIGDGLSLTITAPTLAKFENTVDGTSEAGSSNLTVTGNAEFDGPVGVGWIVALGSLGVTGTTLISGDTIATSTLNGGAGTVTFGGAVTIWDGVSVSVRAPTLARFENTVDGYSEPGSSSLTVTGNAEFAEPVGFNVALGALGITGTTLINTDTIATSTLNGGGGTVAFGGAVTIADGVPAYITAPTSAWFQATVDGQSEPGSSSLTVTGNAEFDRPVGSNVRLGSLSVTGTTLINTDATDTITLNGGAGTVTFGGAVTIEDIAPVNITAPGLAKFESTVDGYSEPGSSSLTITGNAEFDNPVGSGVALGLLSVTGTTLINTDTIATSTLNSGAGTVTFGGTVTIADGVSVSVTAPTLVRLEGLVDGQAAGTSSLTVAGNAVFEGQVGGVNPLASLYVTGTTTMGSGLVSTIGDQSYAGLVTLANNTTLQGGTLQSAAGTPIQVAGGGYNLALAFGGTTVVVGSDFTGINNLIVGGSYAGIPGGTTQLLGTIATTGTQEYYDPVILASNVTAQSNGENITFLSTIDADAAANNRVLSLIAGAGNVALFGVVGGSQPPMSLYISAYNITLHDVHTSLTAGIQEYSATGIIEFESDYTGWDFTLNTNRSAPPPTATIYKTDGDLTIQFTNSVTMSEYDKLCVSDGNLDITAGDSVTIGDIYASGALVVTAPSIQILTRPSGLVTSSTGQQVLDTGVEIVATSITFSTTPTITDEGPPPVYATSTGTVTNPGPGTVLQFAPVPLDFTPTGPNGGGAPVVLCPVASWTAVVPAAGFTITLASYNPLTPQAAVTIEEMGQVLSSGIFAHASSFDEMMTICQGQRFYAGWDGNDSFSSTTSSMAAAILQSYRDLLWEKVENAQNGQVELVYRGPAIRQLFDSALDAYLVENPHFEEGSFRTFLFGKFNRSQEVRKLAERLALLCVQVEKLGLTPAESAVAKELFFRDLRPSRIAPKDFEAIIRSVLPRTVAGEKNLPPKARAGLRRRWSI
jgi:filamentous hemagglutinin family protein